MANETEALSAEECLQIAVVQGVNGEVLSGLWYVGVTLSILSSIASNLGVNIQKYSMLNEFKKMDADEKYVEKPYIFQQIWWVGLLMVIAGSIGDFAALGFAAQTLATPVGGFTMVANVFFAHFFLKEHLGLRDVIATLFVISGVVAVAASAEKSEKTYTLQCLLELYKRPVFFSYVFAVLLPCIVLLYLFTRYLNKLRETEPSGPKYKRWRRIHPICPAALSGIIGAQSVLFAKCTVELIKKTFEGESQFKNWETYLIICCMIFTIFNQLHWLAAGLRYFEAVVIIPYFQCFFITGGVIGGGVFFDEMSGLRVWEKLLFTAGVLLTIFGVYLLSQREQHHQEAKVSPETAFKSDLMSTSMPILDTNGNVVNNDGHDPVVAAAYAAHAGSDKPAPPMPMSLQFPGLVITDLYEAVRHGMSTPENSPRTAREARHRRISAIDSAHSPALRQRANSFHTLPRRESKQEPSENAQE